MAKPFELRREIWTYIKLNGPVSGQQVRDGVSFRHDAVDATLRWLVEKEYVVKYRLEGSGNRLRFKVAERTIEYMGSELFPKG